MEKLYAIRETKTDGFLYSATEDHLELSKLPKYYMSLRMANQLTRELNDTELIEVSGNFEVVEITINPVEE